MTKKSSKKLDNSTIPTNVQQDLDELVQAYMDATLPILQKDKFIIAMGMKLTDAGKPLFIGLQPKADTIKGIQMNEHLAAYRSLLKKQAATDAKAVLLAYDVRMHNEPYHDAVSIELEHEKGIRMGLVVPYRFTGLFKRLAIGPVQRFASDTPPIL